MTRIAKPSANQARGSSLRHRRDEIESDLHTIIVIAARTESVELVAKHSNSVPGPPESQNLEFRCGISSGHTEIASTKEQPTRGQTRLRK
jgi:hypothetical protein